MGEVRVPAWAKWRAQTQRAVENFPISGTPIERELSAPSPRSRARRPRSTPTSACSTRDDRRRHRRGRRRPWRRGRLGRALPDRRLPDRLGHVEQHEHQRGHRHAWPPRRSGSPGAPERPRERLAVVQRRLPVGHPRRGHRRDRPRPDPGAASTSRPSLSRKADEFADGRQERPHPPDGRHPGHPRPGVRRLRRGGPLRGRAAARPPCPASASCRSAAPPSAPASTPRPGSPPRSSSGSPAELDLPLTEARDHFEAQSSRDGAGRGVRPAADHRRRPGEDRQRPALDGLRPAHRARRDLPARPAARQLDHAGQGEPGDPGGDRSRSPPRSSATTPPSPSPARPATSSST